jgi:hypothetical protein
VFTSVHWATGQNHCIEVERHFENVARLKCLGPDSNIWNDVSNS